MGRSVFGRDAALYDRARSAYPGALYAAIAARLPAGPRVLEIGAGTGLATRGLAGLEPSRLVLVEPDRGMADFLATRFPAPQAEVICAPFIDAPVKGRFDLVACAAAFHWLDPDAAFARIAGLLNSGGICALWWNSYFGHGLPDPFGEAVAAFLREEAIVLPPSYVGGRHYAFDTDHHAGAMAAAGFGAIESRVFSAPRAFDAWSARDLYATFSFIEVLTPVRRSRILDGIGRIVDDRFGGHATAVCATALYTGVNAG
ncbi:class I SAM-dependent methyltransferase [Parablastomonas sp. CN1-191]|uniref:class I SAM-dependent methyltransferase n=1 Tax=Parablastomonas sp. CN1-191 TaxID=3400908 RepID=UPI003BF9107C